MNPKINRLPGGFLGFVDVKAMGDNPGYLAPLVGPGLDMAPFYLSTGRRTEFVGVNVPALSSGLILSTLTVPQNKAWLIENIIASGSLLGAGQIFTGAICIATAQTPGITSVVYAGESVTHTVNDFVTLSLNFQGGFYVAPSGYRIGLLVTQATGGAVAPNLVVALTEVDYP